MKDLIKSCIRAQVELNDLAASPGWMDGYHQWLVYAAIEMGELVDHLAPYHWKSNKPDKEQAFIELIDIFHFLVSHKMQKSALIVHEDREAEVVQHIENILKVDPAPVPPSFYLVGKPPESYTLQMCFNMMAWFKKTPQQFFEMYLAKDVLNIFRQHNGYKNGSYTKTWSGREDNEYLAEIVKGFDFNLPNSKQRLYDLLGEQYKMYSQTTEG